MKILFVHKQILFPRDTGGKIRVLNVLQHLARRHSVTYLCNLRRGEERYLPQMEALGLRMAAVPGEAAPHGGIRFYANAFTNILSPRPYSVNRNFDPAVRRRVAAELKQEPYDLLICDCVQMARHTIGLRAPASILFQHNVEAQILKRHSEVAASWPKRAYMRSDWHKMRRFERACGRHFDTVIAVSDRDRDIFAQAYGWRHVQVIDTAVDTEYFQPSTAGEIDGRVVFVGSMDYMPNQDGIVYFVREVWPRIRQARPNATFQIVGRNPPVQVLALGAEPGVEVAGGVPDVRPHLAQAAVVVVPLLVGGGTRLKIYEAMASGKAVVSTTIGAEGLPLTPGEHFLQADTSEQFATAVARLLDDASLRAELGGAANRFVRERYDSETVSRQFEDICAATVERSGRGSARNSPMHAGQAAACGTDGR